MSVVLKVIKWRELYWDYHETGKKMTLKQAAAEVKGTEKKTLDHFRKQLLEGIEFGFNFKENLDDNVARLTDYNKSKKHEQQKSFSGEGNNDSLEDSGSIGYSDEQYDSSQLNSEEPENKYHHHQELYGEESGTVRTETERDQINIDESSDQDRSGLLRAVKSQDGDSNYDKRQNSCDGSQQ